MSTAVSELQQIFKEKGKLNYGENITQLEHAVQCYYLAKQINSSIELCVAAFLHDVGHLLYDESNVNSGIDFHHEEIGADFLEDMGVMNTVTDLIRSHVWAKRFLITQDPGYLDGLSQASINSFHVQGGFLSESEFKEYSNHPQLNECLQLRRWDDEGKIEGLDFSIPNQVWEEIEACLISQ